MTWVAGAGAGIYKERAAGGGWVMEWNGSKQTYFVGFGAAAR